MLEFDEINETISLIEVVAHVPESERKINLSSIQKTTLIATAIVAVAGVSYLVVAPGGDSCGTIFEQTAPRLQANLDIIQNKGQIAVSRETIQELSDSAQRVGLHLKTCCTVLQGGQLDSAQFQQCVDGAAEYDRQVATVAQQVVAAEQAAQEDTASEMKKRSRRIQESVAAATGQAESLVSQSVKLVPVPPPVKPATGGSVESEPNNNILESNLMALNQPVRAEIMDTTDVDFFMFTYAEVRRDKIRITLQNQSTTLRPHLKIYNKNKSEILSLYDKTYGANVATDFAVAQGSEYYLQVSPYETQGTYILKVETMRAYDTHEPNDDVFTATEFENRTVLDANIMDDGDTDWYRITAKDSEQVTLKLENRSRTLRPSLAVYNNNKSTLDSSYDRTYGADLELSFKSTPGEDYYVEVRPYESSGEYRLHVK